MTPTVSDFLLLVQTWRDEEAETRDLAASAAQDYAQEGQDAPRWLEVQAAVSERHCAVLDVLEAVLRA